MHLDFDTHNILENLRRISVRNKLLKLLAYYESREMYEQCIYIRNKLTKL